MLGGSDPEVGEMLGAEQPVEFDAAEQLLLEYQIDDIAPGQQCFLGYRRGLDIPQVWAERGDEADRVFDTLAE